jgi:hypothetical protein
VVGTLKIWVQFSVNLGYVPSIVGIDLHYLFYKERAWLLMPEDGILEKFRESLDFVGGQYFAQRERFPDFPVCLFMTKLSFLNWLT